ncbi:hypothetical protein J1N35_042620 [Gossypium stocksii]|uniref:Phorbol-ester/DAG-type domain-containing protein n=1 Tax=Gossypium stocksii TaxID=47602 RepID=A0A9D3U5T5_9ROSI|nr:hypothetical protein J1N35_042620 [Gossypium stocksii]
MEIQHFIHEHLFSFIKEGNRMKRCKVCWTYLSGPTYGCKPCKYFLHKSCLDEFKEEVQSSFHLCPLRISPHVNYDLDYYGFDSGLDDCFLCYGAITSNFSYKCKFSCRFQAHVECAVKPLVEYSDEDYSIQHFTHIHPLKLVDSNKKHTVICSFCEELCSSSSSSTYGCMKCKFFLHKSCMKRIPRQLINHCIHRCTLIFISSPYSGVGCDCCGKIIAPGMKFSCGACEFNLHVKCALFPTIDSEDAKEIQHFCHRHTLALVENDEEYGSQPRCVACAEICLAPAPTFRFLKDKIEEFILEIYRANGAENREKWCRECRRFSSGPAYGCERCGCFIHKSRLDEHRVEVQSFFHPCPLTISTESFSSYCFVCFKTVTSNFVYKCKLSCRFQMHVECALKPMVEYSDEEYTIQHFTHLYPLKLVDSNQKHEVICSICEGLCSSSSSSTLRLHGMRVFPLHEEHSAAVLQSSHPSMHSQNLLIKEEVFIYDILI